jgi:hypothetical protein
MKSRYFGMLFQWLAALFISGSVWAQSSTEPVPSNSIDTLTVAQQGGNTVVKVVLKQPLAAQPSSFSVANPAPATAWAVRCSR